MYSPLVIHVVAHLLSLVFPRNHTPSSTVVVNPCCYYCPTVSHLLLAKAIAAVTQNGNALRHCAEHLRDDQETPCGVHVSSVVTNALAMRFLDVTSFGVAKMCIR